MRTKYRMRQVVKSYIKNTKSVITMTDWLCTFKLEYSFERHARFMGFIASNSGFFSNAFYIGFTLWGMDTVFANFKNITITYIHEAIDIFI